MKREALHNALAVLACQGTPLVLLIDWNSGLLPSHFRGLKDHPLAGCPILFRQPGTRVEVLNERDVIAVLRQLPKPTRQRILETLGGQEEDD